MVKETTKGDYSVTQKDKTPSLLHISAFIARIWYTFNSEVVVDQTCQNSHTLHEI